MNQSSASDRQAEAGRPTCAICNQPFSPHGGAVYLGAEKALMHRACCDAHPSCHCEPSNDSAASMAHSLVTEQ